MDAQETLHEIKLIKYGVIFLHDKAFLKYNPSAIEISLSNGEKTFQYAPSEIKRVIYNPSSGIFTLKSRSGQKVNIAYKNYSGQECSEFEKSFRAYLKQQGIKGWVMGYYRFGRL